MGEWERGRANLTKAQIAKRCCEISESVLMEWMPNTTGAEEQREQAHQFAKAAAKRTRKMLEAEAKKKAAP
jgi:hypothetical protein